MIPSMPVFERKAQIGEETDVFLSGSKLVGIHLGVLKISYCPSIRNTF